MAACASVIRDVRWVVSDGPVQFDGQGPATLFINCEAVGDCPQGVNGWHAKEFPAGYSLTAALNEAASESSYLLWDRIAPPALPETWRVGFQKPGTDLISHSDVHDAEQAVAVIDQIEQAEGSGCAWPERLVGREWSVEDLPTLRARFRPAVAEAVADIEGVAGEASASVEPGLSPEQLAEREGLRRRFLLKLRKCYEAHASWRTDQTMRNLFASDLIFAVTQLLDAERPGCAAAVKRAFEIIFPGAVVPVLRDLTRDAATAEDGDPDYWRIQADALTVMRATFIEAMAEEGTEVTPLGDDRVHISGGCTPGSAGTEVSLDAVLAAVLEKLSGLPLTQPIQGV